jgi:hypothetical protein
MMTKAEKQALEVMAEVMAKQAEWNEFRASYPERFAKLLYDFGKLGNTFEVKRLDNLTYLFKSDESYTVEAELLVTLTEEPQQDYVWNFEELERQVAEYYAKEAEAERQYRVRLAALGKVRATLSAEELKLLGL